MKKYLTALVIAGLLFFQSPLKAQESNSINLADIPLLVGSHLLLNLALGLAHQVGPIIAAKIFIAFGAEFSNQTPPETSHANVKLDGICLDNSVPEFKNPVLNIVMYGSAPISGFLGCILALKTANILSEYNKINDFKIALSKGLQKDLFNKDQSSSLKTWILTHLALNCFDCVPRLYDRLDGQKGGNTGAQVNYWAHYYMRKK